MPDTAKTFIIRPDTILHMVSAKEGYMSDKEKGTSHKNAGGQPLEDRALKGAARLFGEELMPLLGVEGKVRRIAPTEEVDLNPQDFMQDLHIHVMGMALCFLVF